MRNIQLSVLLSVSTLAHGVVCALSGLPSDLSLWQWQTSVVVDRWLYIFGGEYYTLRSTNAHPLDSILSIDLSRSWTTANVSGNNITIPTSSSVQARRPYVWYDLEAKMVFQWGGWNYESNDSSIWAFAPDGSGGGSWSTGVLPASVGGVALTPSIAGAFTTSTTNFYSLGGAQAPLITNPNLALEGLLSLDFSNSAWTNATSIGASVAGFLIQSQMTFVPNFGKAGILAVIGGIATSNQTWNYGSAASLVDMSDITIYDISSSTWFHQNATGPKPPPRQAFCIVGTPNKDNSSYEIFVFAGGTSWTYDLPNPGDTGYLDVYVLSLPAFTWFKADAPTQQRRAFHFCQAIGERQMLVIGGSDPSSQNWNNLKDPWTNGLNVFDMTNWTWTESYDSNAAGYERAAAVDQHYANNYKSPVWSDNALETIFRTKTQVRPTSSPSSSPSSSPTPAPQSHTGAIAGGVVGGILGLLILVTAIFWILRRRRRNQNHFVPDASKPVPEMGEGLRHELEAPPAEMEGNRPSTKDARPGVSELDAASQFLPRPGTPR